ncbi:MAG: lipopolysaccharide biosynthesis protein [Luteolibacter sp.]
MATRSNRFLAGVLTGYGSIGVNIVFTLTSIPLALSYLTKEEFGLWALALQFNGYLGLIDFGMSGSVGRFLADHKDDVNGASYREYFSTGTLVFLTQGILVVVVGIGMSWTAPGLLSIPKNLEHDFSVILRILCTISGVSIVSRSLGAPLWAFQRMDVVNLAGSIGLVLQFFAMWIGFHLGWGVLSFAYAAATPTLVTLFIYSYVSIKHGYFPNRAGWMAPRWTVFKRIFGFGRDTMLVALGSQLVNATQITIISRILGLDAAAAFSIYTKLYSMSLQLFHKVVESAAPGLAEMHVRGELKSFVMRYWDIIAITIASATAGAIALTSCNSAFVSLWTRGKFSSSLTLDLLLGLLVLVTSLSRCFVAIFGITKNLRTVRIIYFIEGVVFVPSAVFAARWYGIEGVLAASLVVHIAVTLFTSGRAASKILGSCRPMLGGIVLSISMMIVALGVAWVASFLLLSPELRLIIGSLLVFASALIVWPTIIPKEIRLRVLSTLIASARRIRNS